MGSVTSNFKVRASSLASSPSSPRVSTRSGTTTAWPRDPACNFFSDFRVVTSLRCVGEVSLEPAGSAITSMAASLATLAAFAFSPGTREHALAKWVTSQGGFVGKVAAETRGGLRGLFVSEDVERSVATLQARFGKCVVAAGGSK